jgi:glycosyltransferase involved in cell wall biosynthesis
MNTLLLIPSILKKDVDSLVAADRHPTMDYYALAQRLRQETQPCRVEILDYAAVEASSDPRVQRMAKYAGRDFALAMMGFLRRNEFDAIFTNGENVSIPLALLLRGVGVSAPGRRPGHVTIAHKLSTGKKRLFFKGLGLHREIDTLFVYAASQKAFGVERLGIPAKKLRLIPFHADSDFYRPLPDVKVNENQISAAGLEWRDYPTLIAAVKDMSDLLTLLAAASPWSKHANETAKRELPPNVKARRYEYGELRDLYASSAFVVVPLYENDFQAGVTTLLEAMAMGKAVIVTETTGQRDVVVHGENGLTTPPGDVPAWKEAIVRLRNDAVLRERLGRNARRWIEENATLTLWVDNIVNGIRDSVPQRPDKTRYPDPHIALEAAQRTGKSTPEVIK